MTVREHYNLRVKPFKENAFNFGKETPLSLLETNKQKKTLPLSGPVKMFALNCLWIATPE